MDSKKVLVLGGVLVVVGLFLCKFHFLRHAACELVAGLVTLGLLLAGLLFLSMGYVAAREDRDTAAKDAAEAQRIADLSAKA